MNYALSPCKVLMLSLLTLCCTLGSAVADEEESYYLEQMRKQSQTEAGKPEQALPEQDGNLLAETDLKNMVSTDDSADSNIAKPEFNKPKLELFKPEL